MDHSGPPPPSAGPLRALRRASGCDACGSGRWACPAAARRVRSARCAPDLGHRSCRESDCLARAQRISGLCIGRSTASKFRDRRVRLMLSKVANNARHARPAGRASPAQTYALQAPCPPLPTQISLLAPSPPHTRKPRPIRAPCTPSHVAALVQCGLQSPTNTQAPCTPATHVSSSS